MSRFVPAWYVSYVEVSELRPPSLARCAKARGPALSDWGNSVSVRSSFANLS
jgi:hypothetical protein